MKRNNYLMTILIALITVFTSCSARQTNSEVSLDSTSRIVSQKVGAEQIQVVGQTQNVNLPDTIKLHFKEIEPECILSAGDLTSLKKVKVEQIGEIDGQQINVILFSDQDNNIHGVFEHKGNKYKLDNLGYATDLDLLEIHQLKLIYNSEEKNIALVSSIGSSILGYTYLLYDESSESWFSFHNWGTPEIVDINQDGVKEVLLKFSGLHNNRSDLNMLSLRDGRLMTVDINSEVYTSAKLDENKVWLASKYIKKQGNKYLVQISVLNGNEALYLYNLEYDEQNPYLLQLRKEI